MGDGIGKVGTIRLFHINLLSNKYYLLTESWILVFVIILFIMEGLDDLEMFNAQYAACKGKGGRLKRLESQPLLNPLSKGNQLNSSIKNAMIDDLRRSRLEKWCRKHGHQVKFELKDKIALRKWFYSLDSDGSGEVNAEELQDPMLSTGTILVFSFALLLI